MFRNSVIVTDDDVEILVRQAGQPGAPAVVLIHGWSQSSLLFRAQLDDPGLTADLQLVAYDLRGHGGSQAPPEKSAYTAEAWAGELRSVIEQTGLHDVVLVGWSFGGYVICDYLRAYGSGNIAGLNFVDWAVMLGASEADRALTGSGFNDYYEAACSHDQAINIAAIRGFVRTCSYHELPAEVFETVLCINAQVSPFVRFATADRPALDNTDLLAHLLLPVLVSQGSQDKVTTTRAAERILAVCPQVTGSIYPQCGHMPFLEYPDRFNAELGAFVRALAAGRR